MLTKNESGQLQRLKQTTVNCLLKSPTESCSSSSVSSPQFPSSKRRRGKKSYTKQDSDSEKQLASTSSKTSVNEESRRRTRSSASISENLPDTQVKDKASPPPPSLSLPGKGKGKSKKKAHSRESKRELKTNNDKKNCRASSRYECVYNHSVHGLIYSYIP